MTKGTHMRRFLPIAALALLPGFALAQAPTPATLTPRAAVPAPSGLTLVPGDSITVIHNGVATTTLLPSLGAFLGTGAAPLASNTVPGLMRGDGTSITVDPTTGTASVVGTAATPLTGPVLSTDTFLIVRGSGASAVPYSVTVPQLTAALSGLADGTTLGWNATTHQLYVIGQAPTAASTVPALSNLNVLLADGTYLTGPVLQALLGVSTSSSSTSTPSPTPTPTATSTSSFPLTFAGAAGALTGTQVLTAFGGGSTVAANRDGNGNLLVPAPAYTYGVFETAGPIPIASTITATFGANGGGTFSIGRMSADGQNGAFVIFGDSSSEFTVAVTITNGTTSTNHYQSIPLAGHTSAGVRVDSNNQWHPQVDGADVTSIDFSPFQFTNPQATGYVVFGSADIANATTAVSQISVQ